MQSFQIIDISCYKIFNFQLKFFLQQNLEICTDALLIFYKNFQGFVSAVSIMRSFVPAIYDVTVAIPKDQRPPTMLGILKRQSSVVRLLAFANLLFIRSFCTYIWFILTFLFLLLRLGALLRHLFYCVLSYKLSIFNIYVYDPWDICWTDNIAKGGKEIGKRKEISCSFVTFYDDYYGRSCSYVEQSK